MQSLHTQFQKDTGISSHRADLSWSRMRFRGIYNLGSVSVINEAVAEASFYFELLTECSWLTNDLAKQITAWWLAIIKTNIIYPNSWTSPPIFGREIRELAYDFAIVWEWIRNLPDSYIEALYINKEAHWSKSASLATRSPDQSCYVEPRDYEPPSPREENELSSCCASPTYPGGEASPGTGRRSTRPSGGGTAYPQEAEGGGALSSC
ncbi:hypothetical protein OROMI_022899 [Orobanche minor]